MFFCQYRIPIKSIRYHANRNKEKYTKQKRGIYTDEDLKWDTPPLAAFHSIHLSVTVAIESLVGRLKASHYKSSRVYTHQSQEQNQKPPKKDSIIPYIIFGSLFVLYDTYRRNRTYLSKRYK